MITVVIFFSILGHELTISKYFESTSSSYCGKVFQIGFNKLFASHGFELESSRSWPPENLGLQV
jgi:hypothetical protein